MPARPPVVDDLWSRALESRRVTRSFVKRAEVLEQGPGWVLLRTTAGRRSAVRWHFDANDRDVQGDDRGEVEGRVRLDLVDGGVLRVRYAEGDDVPEHATPMLIGSLEPPPGATVEEGDGVVVLRGGGATVEVALRPLAITVRADDGSAQVEIGGREKNFFNAWDAYNTGICRTIDGDRPIAAECFTLGPQEAVYGFGERFTALDKVGQTVDLVMVEGTGTASRRAYKNVPFWVSTAGYGVYLNTSARATVWVGSMSAVDVQVGVEEDVLDYFVVLGDIPAVLHRYTALTGRAPAPPPHWSFGWWQSKISYTSAAETLDIAQRMRAEAIPLDVIHVDTHWFAEDWRCDLEFAPDRFPDPAGWIAELRALGVRVCLWQLPYIPEGSQLFDDLAAVDGFVQTAQGGIYDVGLIWTPGFEGTVGCIDFTNPAAVEVYQAALRRLLELGVAAIKVDFGEQAPIDGVYHDGTPGHLVHNRYPLLYNRAVAEVTEAVTGERVIWARSAWAGSQRYPLHWGGDSSVNWENIVPQMRGGLSFGLSGFQFWSQDIGGFLGFPDGDLLIRWIQAGVFLSHARIHGAGTRELYAFDDERVRTIGADYVRLRYRLLPYLWATAAEAVATSLPVARPLVVEFQDDPGCWRVDDQWLLGRSLLVAPVATPSGRRRVYLPPGGWTDWWTGKRCTGPCWIEVAAPIERIPLWLRDGAVVPMGPVIQHIGERPVDTLTLRIAPFPDEGTTELTVPLDDGREVRIRYRAASAGHEVTVDGDVDCALDVLGASPPEISLRLSA